MRPVSNFLIMQLSNSRVYRTVEFKDMARKQYEKYYFRNNRLCGAILIGDVSRMGEMTEAVEKRASFGELFGK